MGKTEVGSSREESQQRVLLRWVQFYLRGTTCEKVDLTFNDETNPFKDGTVLGALIGQLSQKKVPRLKAGASNKLQAIGNLQTVLQLINSCEVRVVAGPEDIYDGKRKLILGLIWSVMLRFQIKNKNEILKWLQERIHAHPSVEVKIENFDSSWTNGLGFCALLDSIEPTSIDITQVSADTPEKNLQLAFVGAEKALGIPPLLDEKEVAAGEMGDRSILTYLSFFFNLAKDKPILSTKIPDAPDPNLAIIEQLREEIADLQQKLTASQEQCELLKKQVVANEIIEEAKREAADAIALLKLKDKQLKETELKSQDVIRRSTLDLRDLMKKNVDMRDEMAKLTQENASFSRKIMELTLKMPLLRQVSSAADAPQGRVTLVFTDVQSSTLQWENTPEAMAASLAMHNDMMRKHINDLGGYEVKTEGDAFMVAFSSAVTAIKWCVLVQKELLEVKWPEGIYANEDSKEENDEDGNLIYKGLRVRMGVHTGEPKAEVDPVTGRMDYFGPMVNRSARVEGTAKGGQIVCSGATFGDIKESLAEIGNPSYVELGAFRLKGLSTDTELVQIIDKKLAGRKFPPLVISSAAEEKKKKMEEEVNNLQSKNSELQEKLKAMEEKAKEDEKKAQELMKWMEEQKKNFASSLDNELREAADQIQQLVAKQALMKQEMESSSERNAQMSVSIDILNEALKRSGFREEELQEQMSTLETEYVEVLEEVNTLEKALEEVLKDQAENDGEKSWLKRVVKGKSKKKVEKMEKMKKLNQTLETNKKKRESVVIGQSLLAKRRSQVIPTTSAEEKKEEPEVTPEKKKKESFLKRRKSKKLNKKAILAAAKEEEEKEAKAKNEGKKEANEGKKEASEGKKEANEGKKEAKEEASDVKAEEGKSEEKKEDNSEEKKGDVAEEKKENDSEEQKAEDAEETKEDAEEKKDDASTEEKKDDASTEEKKDDASTEEKKDDASAEEKKDDASAEEKKDDASAEEKKEDSAEAEETKVDEAEEKKEDAEEKKEDADTEEKKEDADTEEKKEDADAEEKKEDAEEKKEDAEEKKEDADAEEKKDE